MAEKEVRKTTVKKAVRRTTTKVAPRKTVAKKTAPAVSATVRRAPSRLSDAVPRRRSKKPLFIFLALLAVAGASVGIGYSDKGVIDVSSLIAARKQNATPEEQERFKTVPVQQGQTGAVNGGLVGSGKTSDPIPETPADTGATTSTSSSPSEAATTTDAGMPQEASGPDSASEDSPEPGTDEETPVAQ